MIDPSSLPRHVIDALRRRGLSNTEIRSLSPIEAFCHYCEWNGLIGWGGRTFGTWHPSSKPRATNDAAIQAVDQG